MKTQPPIIEEDPTASDRKKDHIELAFKSQQKGDEIDPRFYYEPMLSGHPMENENCALTFAGKTMDYPIWVSSMTGGTTYARIINENLAKACQQFNLGMGLGSCRSLLYSDDNLSDFSVRKYIGGQPLYANLGIAQVEQLVQDQSISKISELIDKLEADGLIIHVNPLQEWTQPEGDRYYTPPVETISRVLDLIDVKLMVKEVGQGIGRSSMEALLQLPLEAIDFAANGGTNFSKLELLRSTDLRQDVLGPMVKIGHSASEMVEMTNQLLQELGEKVKCRQFIISGGVKDFLDGYYLVSKMKAKAIYGQASGFLKHARGSYTELEEYVQLQIEGYKMANKFLRIKPTQT